VFQRGLARRGIDLPVELFSPPQGKR